MRFFDPDTRIFAYDKLQHAAFGFAAGTLLLFGLGFTPVWTLLAVLAVGGAFELGQWDNARGLPGPFRPGTGFGLLDLAADVLGAAIPVALYCYLTYAPLPSHREPFDPQRLMPRQYLTHSSTKSSGADPVAHSDPARLYSPSPRPRSSLNGVPLARV